MGEMVGMTTAATVTSGWGLKGTSPTPSLMSSLFFGGLGGGKEVGVGDGCEAVG